MPTNAGTHCEAEITMRRDITQDLWVLRLHPEHPVAFRPGQFATLALPDGQGLIERAYSIASSPLEPELEFFFELVPEGKLTGRLHALGAGEKVLVRKVTRGKFLLDERSDRKTHLMIATVTGVAPFVSMLRTLWRKEKGRRSHSAHRVFLLHGASRSQELGYDRELGDLQREADWFRYTAAVSRPWEDVAWSGERGRLPGLLLKFLDRFQIDPKEATAYLCGNPLMIEAGRRVLEGAGFPKDSLREERYWVAESTP
jgi:ferredoxin--NADP+ reductase